MLLNNFKQSLLTISFVMISLLSSCSDIELAKEAAKSTSDMNEKFDTMLDHVESMKQTMITMDEEMKSMDSQVSSMKNEMTEMKSVMESMVSFMELMKESMDSMSSYVSSMFDVMDIMSTNMREMKSLMVSMQSFMEDLNLYGKQYFSSASRITAWDQLADPSTKIESKLLYATIYYYSYEYQTLSEKDYTNKELLSELLYQATQEYFLTLAPYFREAADQIDHQQKANPSFFEKLLPGALTVNSKENKRNVLYALSTTLHQVNYHQLQYNNNPISFEHILMDMIVADFFQDNPEIIQEYGFSSTGVLLDPSQDTPSVELQPVYGENEDIVANFPNYLRESLNWIPLSEFMLNMRHNFIDAIVMQKISDLDRVAKYRPNLEEFSKQGSYFLSGWDMVYDDVGDNPALIDKLSFYLEKSQTVRDFLNCFNFTHLDPQLVNIVNNLNTSEQFNEVMQQTSKHFPHSVTRFNTAILHLKSDYTAINYDTEGNRITWGDKSLCKGFVKEFIGRLRLTAGSKGIFDLDTPLRSSSEQITSSDNTRYTQSEEEEVEAIPIDNSLETTIIVN